MVANVVIFSKLKIGCRLKEQYNESSFMSFTKKNPILIGLVRTTTIKALRSKTANLKLSDSLDSF